MDRRTPRGLSAGVFVAAAPALVLSLSAGALAQDSVSRNADGGSGLPGDAILPWDAARQRVSYVVDLAPLTTSWGTAFGVAPLAKSSRTIGTTRFTFLNGASTISQTIRRGAPYPASSYTLWTAPGGGVEPSHNDAALNTSVPRSGTASVFAIGFLDYADQVISGTPSLYNQVVGAQVAFDPAQPSRLYVTRVVAAHNSQSAAQVDRSQFGVGSVDAHGNVYFRADSLTASSSASLLAGENIFRVSLPARASSVNLIDVSGAGDAAASARLVNNGTVTLAAPSCMPVELAGRPLLIGVNLAKQMLHESSPGVVTGTQAHLAGAFDHRGNPSFSPVPLFTGSVGTVGMIAKSAQASKADRLAVIGVDAAGAPVSTRLLAMPPGVNDACDLSSWPVAGAEFRHFDSQVTFRGGNGPVAVGRDQLGRAIVAATVYHGTYPGGPATPYVAILAARFDPTNANSPVSWTPVAWTQTDLLDGKDILGDYGADGAPGTGDAGEGDGVLDATPIGRIASMSELSVGKTGPSLSAPMVDSVGNVYFTASVSLRRQVGQVIANEYTHGLVRAVYNPGAFCYSLELVLRVDDVFAGMNSGRSYRVAALGLADADSVASEAPWSQSIGSAAWNASPSGTLAPRAPHALGGLVLSARVVYDRNADQLFKDPTIVGGDAASVDEAYNVALYLGATTAPCLADVDDGSGNGVPDDGVDISDLLYYLGLFQDGDIRGDFDDGSGSGTPDSGVDISDLLYFLARFEVGC